MQTKKLIAAALMIAAAAASQAAGKKATKPLADLSDNTPVLMLADVSSLDKKVEVAYTCDSQQGKQSLNAMYGIKNGETAVVQLKAANGQLTPNLRRVMNDTNGKILMQADAVDGGLPKGDQTILFQNCKVDKSATKKLNGK